MPRARAAAGTSTKNAASLRLRASQRLKNFRQDSVSSMVVTADPIEVFCHPRYAINKLALGNGTITSAWSIGHAILLTRTTLPQWQRQIWLKPLLSNAARDQMPYSRWRSK